MSVGRLEEIRPKLARPCEVEADARAHSAHIAYRKQDAFGQESRAVNANSERDLQTKAQVVNLILRARWQQTRK